MRAFHNLPIQRKLVIAFALTTAVALMLASGFFAISTWLSEKEKATIELQAIANLIGANSTAALAFGDSNAANEILAALATIDDITLAVLLDEEGHEFARYLTKNIMDSAEDGTPINIHRISQQESQLRVSSTVYLDSHTIGTVVIYGTLRSKILKLQDQMLTAILTTILCFIIAIMIAWRLQLAITNPIRDLTKTMLHVSSKHDYSIRASVTSDDELGVLSQGINDMLARVEERDKQLLQHQRELEDEVQRRTTALKDANLMLRQELGERVRYQEELNEAHKKLERHNREISLLSEMNERIQACHSIDETQPVMTYYASQLFPSSIGALYVYNKSRSLIDPWCAGGTRCWMNLYLNRMIAGHYVRAACM
jgi:hypothetical protein